MKQRRSRRAGFSLLEVVIAVAILGIAAAIAIPSFTGMVRRGKINSHIRGIMNDLSLAQGTARSGKEVVAGLTTRSAGIRIQGTDNYQVIVTDSVDGSPGANEEILKTIAFPSDLGIAFELSAPLPATLMFRSNGTLTNASPTRVGIRDTETNMLTTLAISVTGSVRME